MSLYEPWNYVYIFVEGKKWKDICKGMEVKKRNYVKEGHIYKGKNKSKGKDLCIRKKVKERIYVEEIEWRKGFM